MSRSRRLPWLVIAIGSAVGFMAAYATLVNCLAATRPLPGAVLGFLAVYIVSSILSQAIRPETKRLAAMTRGITPVNLPAADPWLPKRRAGYLWRRKGLCLLAFMPPRLARALVVAEDIALLLVALGFAACVASAVSRGISAGSTLLWAQRSWALLIAVQFGDNSVRAFCVWRSRSSPGRLR